MIETLASERLILEPLDVAHAPEMTLVLADPSLYEFTGGAPPTPEGLTAQYRGQVAGSGDDGEVWHNWVIRLDGAAVGFVQATVTGASSDVAWVVGVAWQGRGIATEAAGAMCQWLIGGGVQRLEAHVHPGHVASQRVAAALGLVDSGELDDEGESIWRRDA
ncbi:MAG: GNAT family N-acetyltransferase [Acidimicrobiia bacterium]